MKTDDLELRQKVRERMVKVRVLMLSKIEEYPGGLTEIARHLKIPPRTLQRQIDNLGQEEPGRPKLGMLDMQKIMKLLDDIDLLQLLLGDVGTVVRLPSPSVETSDPAVMLCEVHAAIGLLITVLRKTIWSMQFPALFKSYGAFLDLIHPLVTKPVVSKNELKALGLAQLKFMGELNQIATHPVAREFVLQAAADLKRTCELIESRLPERAQ